MEDTRILQQDKKPFGNSGTHAPAASEQMSKQIKKQIGTETLNELYGERIARQRVIVTAKGHKFGLDHKFGLARNLLQNKK